MIICVCVWSKAIIKTESNLSSILLHSLNVNKMKQLESIRPCNVVRGVETMTSLYHLGVAVALTEHLRINSSEGQRNTQSY